MRVRLVEGHLGDHVDRVQRIVMPRRTAAWCGWLAAEREPGRAGVGLVMLVTSTTAYVQLGDTLLAVHGDITRAKAPGSIAVPRLDVGRLEVGMACTVADGWLRVGPVVVDLSPAAVWARPRRAPIAGANDVAAGSVALLRSAGGERLAAAEQRLGARTGDVLDALSFDAEALPRSVARLVGFGPGLTPSGDDALCGLLLTLARVDGAHASFAALRSAVRDVISSGDATTAVGCHALSLAVDGEADEVVDDVLSRLAAGFICAQSIRRLLAAGATSGADTLAGMRAALTLGALVGASA